MKYFILLCALLSFGCGNKEDAKEPQNGHAIIKAQFKLYQRLDHAMQVTRADNRTNWLFRDCDATLHEGLRSIYTPNIDLLQAQGEPGVWYRRDLDLGNCYEQRDQNGRRLSQSQISRDMLLGVAWWVYKNDRPDVARAVVEYADLNGDVMGPGAPSRTGIRPSLKATFLKLANWDRLDSHYPVTVSGYETGYARHLAAWHLMLRAEKTGGMESGYHWWIEEQALEQPKNPLYQLLLARYVTGDYEPVREALLDETYFPRDRLPSSDEICEPWLIQRDDGHDWQPCKTQIPRRVFPGAAWLAVAHWLLVENPQ